MSALSNRQRQTLAFITAYIAKSGRSPTYREIGEHLGYARPGAGAVQNLCAVLIQKGYLRQRPRGYRSLVPAEARPC